MSRSEYIEHYKDDAIEEMKANGIPASITLAQGILESGDGNSELARKANNHFGIKCHDWEGKKVYHDDDKKGECFRKYKSVRESFRDHSEFLKKPRYEALFELKITDYRGWAKGLKKAGYATNPKYPTLLIELIEKNDLSQYDQTQKRKKNKKSNTTKTESKVISKRRGSHTVKLHPNNIKFIEPKEGDSFEKIAEEFNMGEWQLYKYNDWEKGSPLFTNGILYLQPKRSKAQEEYHTVVAGESMWDISQQYGIKLKRLYKLNRMSTDQKPETTQKLHLRKKKK